MTDKPNVIVAASASIAIYKTPFLIRQLQAQGCAVRVVLSSNATKLVSAQVFEALCDHPVYVDEFSDHRQSGMEHIELKNWGNLLIYYPATANLIGHLANGLAPSLISTLFLAFRGQIVLAPAMNPDMFGHKMVQHNLKRLARCGILILQPTIGLLACQEQGQGKLMDAEQAMTILIEKGIL